MTELAPIQHAPDLLQRLAGGATCVTRTAIKAVIARGDKLWLLHSPQWDCYKFPGGGMEDGETDEQTLRRELREEVGGELRRLGPCLLTVTELSEAQGDEAKLFRMDSRYYACAVVGGQHAPALEPYEAALGLTPRWVTVEAAAQANAKAMRRRGAPRWLRREEAVLRSILTRWKQSG